MKKIMFFSESLNGGGAEIALVRIVELLCKDYDITVISQTDSEKHTQAIKNLCKYKSFTKRDGSSFLNKLIIKGFLSLPPEIVNRLYLHGNYDIEVSCCEGYSAKIVGASRKNTVKIAYIHTDFVNNPWSASVYKGGEREEQECYSHFDKIICVSETIRDSFVKKYGFEDKTVVIHNLIDEKPILQKLSENSEIIFKKRPSFISVGNYLPVKGYDRLMKAAYKLKDEGYEFFITIMGRPEKKDEIQRLCNNLGLQEYVKLDDFQENPYKFMKNADCYVCSSYAEGYSTAVIEAIICSLPVITTECSGMKEIFGNGEIGIICQNSEEGLYEAMKKVLDNPQLLVKFKENTKEHKSNFTYEKTAQIMKSFYSEI